MKHQIISIRFMVYLIGFYIWATSDVKNAWLDGGGMQYSLLYIYLA